MLQSGINIGSNVILNAKCKSINKENSLVKHSNNIQLNNVRPDKDFSLNKAKGHRFEVKLQTLLSSC